MVNSEFLFKDDEGVEIFVRKWAPDEGVNAKGIVQIAHGMSEHSARYERLAGALTREGYIVYADDHRGHGKTANAPEKPIYCGQDGFSLIVKDMKQLNEIIKKEYKDLPLFLFGHSLGSLLAQRYITLYGGTINGVILSATTGKQRIKLLFGIRLSVSELKKVGAENCSKKLEDLATGDYNKAFEPKRTEFDWLSRDSKEVDKYIKDPYCGGALSAGFYYDLARLVKDIHLKQNMQNIPKDLPIYVFSGEMDPTSKGCKTIYSLLKKYDKLGIKNVSHKFYMGGRHEMLNEINRDEVTNDMINWLNSHCDK